MLIDWFTVVAQIINFLVLVALLKHFLYGRLVRAIDDREKLIAGRLSEAEEKKLDAQREVEKVHAQALDLERQSDVVMKRAQQDADEQRSKLIEKAREAVRELETKWHQDLDRERTAFLEGIRQRAADEILIVVKRALADLACTDVQTCSVQVFLEKLRSFDAAALHDLAKTELLVLSATDLPDETRLQVRRVVEDRLGRPVEMRFERAPGMAWGIELRGSGQRINWTADSYVESLEVKLKEALSLVADG